MTDAELGKWVRDWNDIMPWADDLGGPIAVIAALVALLREAQDAQSIIGHRKLQARLRTVLGEGQ